MKPHCLLASGADVQADAAMRRNSEELITHDTHQKSLEFSPARKNDKDAEDYVAEKNVADAFNRCADVNPTLGAVIALCPNAMEQAKALRRAPRRHEVLFGVPILIKDNIDTKEAVPTTAGSLALANNITHRDAPLVARLREAGAIILGKANLSEWATRTQDPNASWSATGGFTRNPHNLERTPGLSSSGSAVSVASGLVVAAIGTENSGSIVYPASVNGVVGLKPTVGLVSRTHVVAWPHGPDTPGPLAKDVATAAQVLGVIAGCDPSDCTIEGARPYQVDYYANLRPDALLGARIGVLHFTDNSTQALQSIFSKACSVLQEHGAILVDVDYPAYASEFEADKKRVKPTELKATINHYLSTTPSHLTCRTLDEVIEFNQNHPDTELKHGAQDALLKAQAEPGPQDPNYKQVRARLLHQTRQQGIDLLLGKHKLAALVSPTVKTAWAWAAIAGYPHLTVPMGATQESLVGLSFIGTAWHESELLNFGYAYEQASLSVQTHAKQS